MDIVRPSVSGGGGGGLSESEVNDLIAAAAKPESQLESDFAVNSSNTGTTLTDSGLSISCTGTRGNGRAMLLRAGEAAANSKVSIVASSGTVYWALTEVGSITNPGLASGAAQNAGIIGANEYPMTLVWFVRGATSPFTVKVQYAQQTASANDTILREGSSLVAEMIS